MVRCGSGRAHGTLEPRNYRMTHFAGKNHFFAHSEFQSVVSPAIPTSNHISQPVLLNYTADMPQIDTVRSPGASELENIAKISSFSYS